MLRKLLLSTSLVLAPLSALAQSRSAPLAAITLPRAITTSHRGIFNGKRIAYTANVEPIQVTGVDGKPTAQLVGISYVAQNASAARPILFIFNGGPIVGSYVLHMGAFGPKRMAVPDDLSAPASSFRLVDNPHTLLDVADLVFFDPAGTGFSRLKPGVEPSTQFSNVADSRQLAAMVIEWRKLHGRETSPVYLVGESYGTLRAPEAAHQLNAAGVKVDGLVLLGQAVNIIEYAQRRGNMVSYAVSLPTLAATAWYHGKADRKDRNFEQFIADAKTFAADGYITALFQGSSAPAAKQATVANRLEEFTGISAEWYLGHQLRITKTDYQRILFPGKRLATNDARYVGEADGPDPFSPVERAYGRLFQSYLTNDLRAGGVGVYELGSPFAGGLNGWDWGPNKSPFGDWPYGQAVTELMAANPRFKLLVGNGWTDTQTTVGAMHFLVDQSGWPQDRVRVKAYHGGHMPYTVEKSLIEFTSDVRTLVTGH